MQHVCITGSTRGIGFGLAKRFIEAGWKVTINGTTEEGVTKAVNELNKLYSNAEIQGFSCDVTDENAVANLWGKAVGGFGAIDIWINNAGIPQERKLVWDVSTENTNKIINVNILGMIYGSRIAVKEMLKQGYGQIYNMEGFGSDGMMMAKMTLYGTTKRALRYFSKSLIKETKGTPIIIGTISPGMVYTDFIVKPMQEDKADLEKSKKILNILVDDVDVVTSFLVKKILSNNKHGAHINWLTKRKLYWKFLSSPFKKKDFF